eukprot:239146_1
MPADESTKPSMLSARQLFTSTPRGARSFTVDKNEKGFVKLGAEVLRLSQRADENKNLGDLLNASNTTNKTKVAEMQDNSTSVYTAQRDLMKHTLRIVATNLSGTKIVRQLMAISDLKQSNTSEFIKNLFKSKKNVYKVIEQITDIIETWKMVLNRINTFDIPNFEATKRAFADLLIVEQADWTKWRKQIGVIVYDAAISAPQFWSYWNDMITIATDMKCSIISILANSNNLSQALYRSKHQSLDLFLYQSFPLDYDENELNERELTRRKLATKDADVLRVTTKANASEKIKEKKKTSKVDEKKRERSRIFRENSFLGRLAAKNGIKKISKTCAFFNIASCPKSEEVCGHKHLCWCGEAHRATDCTKLNK